MKLQKATIKDIKAIHNLIEEYSKKGLMLYRHKAELEKHIRDYTIFKDKKILGCCALRVWDQKSAEIYALAVDEKQIGKGKVIWIGDKFGRAYWGNKVRRWRVYGNTPPTFMRMDNSDDTKYLREYLRETLSELIESAGVKTIAKLDAQKGTVHLAAFQKPECKNELLLFLIHNGDGRKASFPVTLDSSLKIKQGQALVDFDRKIPVTVDDKGVIQIPDFSHSCIVTLNK